MTVLGGTRLLAAAGLAAWLACPRGAQAQDSAATGGIRVTVRPDTLQLVARRDSFRILIQGAPVGGQVVDVSRVGDSLVFQERTEIPLLDLSQQTRVVMDARSLAPWSVDQSGHFGNQQAETHVVSRDGRVHGRAQTPQPGGRPRVTEIDTLLSPGVLDVNQVRFALPFLPVAEGTELTVDVFNPADASVRPYTLRIEPGASEVADSTFGDVYRVVVFGGEPQRFTITRAPPRRVVRVESVGQPLVFELVW